MKGHTNNPNGRPPGSKNKTTEEIRQIVKNLVSSNVKQLKKDLSELTPKERVEAVTKLLAFVLPKCTEIDLETTIEDKNITIEIINKTEDVERNDQI